MGDRCPAPVRTDGGTIECVTRRPCPDHPQLHWRLLAPILRIIWTIRPWWPNTLGRARDAGTAHTPLIHPCKACDLEEAYAVVFRRRDHHAIRRRHEAGTYVPGHEPQGTR